MLCWPHGLFAVQHVSMLAWLAIISQKIYILGSDLTTTKQSIHKSDTLLILLVLFCSFLVTMHKNMNLIKRKMTCTKFSHFLFSICSIDCNFMATFPFMWNLVICWHLDLISEVTLRCSVLRWDCFEFCGKFIQMMNQEVRGRAKKVVESLVFSLQSAYKLVIIILTMKNISYSVFFLILFVIWKGGETWNHGTDGKRGLLVYQHLVA